MASSADIDTASVAFSVGASSYSSRSTATTSTKKVRRRKGGGTHVNEAPAKPPFTTDLVSKGLSQLGRTADGLRPAYLRLEVVGTDLADLQTLSGYQHIQTLLLSGNELTSLKALSSLPNLTCLDVSSNKLKEVLDYQLPPGQDINLRVANISNNCVATIQNLSRFSRLQSLNLDRNQIEAVTGLHGLSMLRTLSLAHNRLRTARGLEALHSLRELNLEGNQLGTLEHISTLRGLEVLHAQGNALQHLRGVQHLTALRKLDVSNNAIASLHEFAHVQEAQLLGWLSTAGNPVERAMNVRLHLVHLLPQVAVLNEQPVEPKEKVLAGNMHGADAEALRAIRRKYFPSGELDDGGGALPPTSAGLVASQSEEEIQEGAQATQAFVRVDAWARSVRPDPFRPPSPLPVNRSSTSSAAPTPPPPAAPDLAATGGKELLQLADQLASVCSGQVQLARVCYQWVAAHVAPPHIGETGSVTAPLFAAPNQSVESVLLAGVSGTWSERASWLFAHLCRACQLEAVMISGYWKDGTIRPGDSILAHNHCWAGVKVNGRWRLVDVTAAAMVGGREEAWPFYVPPEAFIYSYFPLEAHWQLMREPLSLDAWWDLPHLSVAFFARGMQLLTRELPGVVRLPAIREGETLPSLQVSLAAPLGPGQHLRHTVYDAATGARVAVWPLQAPCDSSLAYQQVEHGEGKRLTVQFGARTFSALSHALAASFPAPGEYLMQVQLVTEVPGGMPLTVGGLGLVLRLEESEEMMLVKVVVPEVEPWDPEDGLLHDPAVTPCLLPATLPEFVRMRGTLISPGIASPLEADRPYDVDLVAPGASRVIMALPDRSHLMELDLDEDTSPPHFRGLLTAPRAPYIQALALVHQSDLGACAWVPLLTFKVAPQSQHIVPLPDDLDTPEFDPSDPNAQQASELFRAMDHDADGLVSRKEMLAAFRRNRQVADILKFPAHIAMSDGTFETFVDGFLSIDAHKLGTFTFDELCVFMGLKPRDSISSEESEEEEEFSQGADDSSYFGSSRPESPGML